MKTMPVAVEERVFLVKSISAEVIFTIPKQKGVHINSHLFLVTKKNSQDKNLIKCSFCDFGERPS